MFLNGLISIMAAAAIVNADSIILNNDCKRTSEECVIHLETIKGEPGRDCAIFSTTDRLCSIDGQTSSASIAPPTHTASISDTDEGTVVTWHGTKENGQGGETVHLIAGSVWSRMPREQRKRRDAGSESGIVVECRCKPVQREKRAAAPPSSSSLMTSRMDILSDSNAEPAIHRLLLDEKQFKDCDGGFRATSSRVSLDDQSIIIRSIVASSSHICSNFCRMDFITHCNAFGFTESTSEVTENCVLFSTVPQTQADSEFVLYEKC